MDAKLWNIGVKVANVPAEVAFFVALGGRVLAHERLTTPQGEAEYALLEFGGTRLFLTSEAHLRGYACEPITGRAHPCGVRSGASGAGGGAPVKARHADAHSSHRNQRGFRFRAASSSR